MQVTILGQTPAQKNNKQIARLRDGRTIIVSNKTVQTWQKDAAKQLGTGWIGKTATEKVRVDYMFYVKDRRRRDIDNMIATVNDALVKAQLLVDDSWQWLSIGSADAELDPENPRAVITIHGL